MNYPSRILWLLSLIFSVAACREPVDRTGPGTADIPFYSDQSALPAFVSSYLDVGDTRLYVEQAGEGQTVVMIHGGPGMSHHYFQPAFDYLSRGYHLIYYDQRLSGLSDAACDSSKVTYSGWVEDLEAIRQSTNSDQLILISHSWGARIAIRYAEKYPDRVQAIVFLNPVGLSPEVVQVAGKTLQERLSPGDKLAQQKLILSQSFKDGKQEAILQAYRFSFAQNIFRRAILDSLNLYIADQPIQRQQKLGRLFRDQASSIYNDYNMLPFLTPPCLIIHGSYDATPRSSIEQMDNMLPRSSMKVIQDAGHFSFIEAPDSVASELVPFLQSLPDNNGTI